MSNPTRTQKLESLKTKFSIKTFISDFPRLVNQSLSTIVEELLHFYTPSESGNTGNIGNINRIDCTYLKATTVNAENLIIKDQKQTTTSINDILDRLTALENKINNLKPITQAEINEIYNNPR